MPRAEKPVFSAQPVRGATIGREQNLKVLQTTTLCALACAAIRKSKRHLQGEALLFWPWLQGP